MGLRFNVKIALTFIMSFFLTIPLYPNTDNANAIYLAWEDDGTTPVGQLYIFGLVPGGSFRMYESDLPGVTIDNHIPAMDHTFSYEGEPIDWISRMGADYPRKYFKMTGSSPFIWESGNQDVGFVYDYEVGLISTNGTYVGNKFFTYMQPVGGSNFDVLQIFNGSSSPVDCVVTEHTAGVGYTGAVYNFTVPADGSYTFRPPGPGGNYFRLEAVNGDVMAFKGDAQESDNDNWFEHGACWNTGAKIGTKIYGKYGNAAVKMTVTGCIGASNYEVYTMPYPAANTSDNTWTLVDSGILNPGEHAIVNPAGTGLFKVISTGGEVLVGGGATIMSHNWGDGDYVPGINTRGPLDTDFYFTTGDFQGGTDGPEASIVAPAAGTTVNITPNDAGPVDGLNPTTAEDMAMAWHDLQPFTTYHVTSDQPIYLFFENGRGAEKAMSLSYLAVLRPIDIQKSVSSPRTHIGDTITYWIDWSIDPENTLAAQAHVWDTIPAEFNIIDAQPPPTDQSGNYFHWDIGSPLPGDAGSMTVTAVVSTSAVEGSLYNNTVLSRIPDFMDYPVYAAALVEIIPRMVEMEKTVDKNAATQGDLLTYTIEYFNTSGLDLTDLAMIYDSLPACFEYVSSDPAGTYDPVEHTVTWGPMFMPVDETGTFELVLEVGETCPIGSIQENWVHSEATGVDDDNDSGDVTILNAPVDLEKSAEPTQALVGDTVTFSLEVENLTSGGAFAGDQGITVLFQNNGQSPSATHQQQNMYYQIINNNSTGINLQDIRIRYYFNDTVRDEEGFEMASNWDNINQVMQNIDEATYPGTNLVHFTRFGNETIGPYETRRTEMYIKNKGSWTNDFDNTDDYSYPGAGWSSYQYNSKIVVEYFMNGSWFIIQGQLPGGTTIDNVMITDDVPQCIDFIDAQNGGAESGDTITWNIGSLNPYDTSAVTWRGEITGECGNSVTNIAEVSATGYGPYSSTIAYVAIPAPPMSITKTAAPYLNQTGDTVTYGINFKNNNPALDQDGITPGMRITYQRNGDAVGNAINPQIRIHNDTAADIDLSNFRIKYYFNDNLLNWNNLPLSSLNASFDWKQCGSATASAVTHTSSQCVAEGCWQGEYIIEFPGCTAAAGDYQQVNGRLHWADWRNFDETNDYSWIDQTAWGPNEQIVLEEYAGGEWKINLGNPPDIPDPLTNVAFWDTIPSELDIISIDSPGLTLNVAGNYINTLLPVMYGQDEYLITVLAEVNASGSPGIVTNTAMVQPESMNYEEGSAEIEISIFTATVTMTSTETITPTITPTITSTATPSFTPTDTPTYTYTTTPSPTYTPTNTPTLTPTSTFSPSDTPTFSPTNTLTATPTSTYTDTITPSRSPTYTNTDTPTYTYTATNTSTPTYTATNTPSFTFTNTGTPTRTDTCTPTASPTYTLTATRTCTPSPTFTITDTISSNTPTITPSYTDTPTATPSFTGTGTATPTATSTGTLTGTPTLSSTNTFTPTSSPTGSPTFTPSFTNTVSPTFTFTITDTISSNTPTSTPSFTLTFTPTPTCTFTRTGTPTYTFTPENTPTQTYTFTGTHTPTGTDTITFTFTYTFTNTSTFTPTRTPTYTPTGTLTNTFSFTPTDIFTATPSPTITLTGTPTFTETPTFTFTPTPSPTTHLHPVEIDITLGAKGDDPKPGAKVTYSITIENNDNLPVTDLFVWDTMPGEVIFLDSSYTVPPVIDGNYITWEPDDSFVLNPGEKFIIEYTVVIKELQEGSAIQNSAGVDYTDPYYGGVPPGTGWLDQRHPPVFSGICFYPSGLPLVYPNPFNPDTAIDGELKFNNIIPGSLIRIYTISGEVVEVIKARYIRVRWDGKNRYNSPCSPGIYYWTVENKETGEMHKDKLFIVNGE